MNLQSDSPQPKRTALTSTKADLRELRQNSQATVKEIQQFLRELKGKSPQEMLGVVASSNLFKSLILATLLVAGGLLLFTAIPYYMAEEEAPVAESTPQPAAQPTAPTPAEANTEPTPEPTTEPTAEASDTLGIGEELTAPPEVNPLDTSNDDFLKELE